MPRVGSWEGGKSLDWVRSQPVAKTTASQFRMVPLLRTTESDLKLATEAR